MKLDENNLQAEKIQFLVKQLFRLVKLQHSCENVNKVWTFMNLTQDNSEAQQ